MIDREEDAGAPASRGRRFAWLDVDEFSVELPVAADDGRRDLRYNPYHGKDGKFTSKHGGGKHGTIVPDKRKPAAAGGVNQAPKPAIDFADRPAAELKAHFALMGADWRKGLSEDERHAIRTYTGQSFDPINKGLRSGDRPTGLVKDIDTAIGRAKLAEHTAVYRGVSDLGALGLRDKNLVGATIRDKAYTSTSLDRRVAEKYAGPSGHVLRIHVPAGSTAASTAKVSRYDKEAEILLPRNATIRITGHGPDAKGRRLIHAELAS